MLSRLGVEIIIIDEFTYRVRAYEGVLSELQEYVDLYMEKYNTLLVVSGSLVSLMEKEGAGRWKPPLRQGYQQAEACSPTLQVPEKDTPPMGPCG